MSSISVTFFNHQEDPYQSDKEQRVSCDRVLSSNRWKEDREMQSSSSDTNREKREKFYDRLGTILQQSFSELSAKLSPDQKRLLFQSLTKTTGVEVFDTIQEKSEKEEKICLYNAKKASSEFLKGVDGEILHSVGRWDIALQCDQLMIARDMNQRTQTTAVCLQYWLTAICEWKRPGGKGWLETEEICLTSGIYLQQERKLAPLLVPNSVTIITSSDVSQVPTGSDLTAHALRQSTEEQNQATPDDYTTVGQLTPDASTISSNTPSIVGDSLQVNSTGSLTGTIGYVLAQLERMSSGTN